MLFRHIVLSALLVGVLSGSLLTAVQFWQVIPIILSAERFEGEPAAAAQERADKEQAASPWAPADGIERTGYTLLTNVLTAFGFALVVLTAIVASRKTNTAAKLNWRHGLLWGATGYAVFFLVPALGLPPEIPGAIAAPLEDRQLWWLFAVVCTAAGLGGALFGKNPWRWAALGLLVVPFLVGIPHSPTAMFAGQPPAAAAQLEELARQFIAATAIATAVLWLALGLTSVWTVRRFVSPWIDPLEE
jgi:cobalt transporter subunit CbtA